MSYATPTHQRLASLLLKAAAADGTIHRWRDGQTYQKRQGKWVRLSQGGKASSSQPSLDTHPWGIKLRERWQKDFAGAVAEYSKLPDTKGGHVLDTDLARELSPEYRSDRSRAHNVHEAASGFIARLYEAKLKRPLGPGEHETVLFMAGGAGSGKSSGHQALGELGANVGLTYDTTMSTESSGVKKIEQALQAGREVVVSYVYRDPVESFVHGALPRAIAQGRTVPIEAFAKTHLGALDTIRKLNARYANHPRVQIAIIDNTRGFGQARVLKEPHALETLGLNAAGDAHVSQSRRPQDLPENDSGPRYHGGYPKGPGGGDEALSRDSSHSGGPSGVALETATKALIQELRDELDAARADGKLSEKLYRGFIGQTDLNKASGPSQDALAAPSRLHPNDVAWVECTPTFGAMLWMTGLLKGARGTKTADVELIALPPELFARLYPNVLMKHKVAAYLKKVPTGKYRMKRDGSAGAQIYRYFYGVSGISEPSDFKEGAEFRSGAGHYTIHGVKDGKLTLSHSLDGKRVELTHDELRERLEDAHRVELSRKHIERIKWVQKNLAAARKYGTPKQIARLVEEMKRLGLKPPADLITASTPQDAPPSPAAPTSSPPPSSPASPASQDGAASQPLEEPTPLPPEPAPSEPSKTAPKAWEEWGERPRGTPVDFTGHPFAHWLKTQPEERFMTVTVKRVGKERGSGDKKRVYDNPKVQDQVVFGFDYGQMLRDSYKAIVSMPEALIQKALGAHGWAKDGSLLPVTQEHVDTALKELRESLESRLASRSERETGLRPLEVNGQKVKGASVYRGDESAYTGPKSNPPEPGTIYLNAIRVHSVEVEPAEHGAWKETAKSPITVAKDILKAHLPESTFVRYRLKPNEDWTIRVSGKELSYQDLQTLLAREEDGTMQKALPSWTVSEEGFDPDDPWSVVGDLVADAHGVVDLGDLLEPHPAPSSPSKKVSPKRLTKALKGLVSPR